MRGRKRQRKKNAKKAMDLHFSHRYRPVWARAGETRADWAAAGFFSPTTGLPDVYIFDDPVADPPDRNLVMRRYAQIQEDLAGLRRAGQMGPVPNMGPSD
jgi:hypothetical protein